MRKFLGLDSPFASVFNVAIALSIFLGIALVFKFADKILAWINNL